MHCCIFHDLLAEMYEKLEFINIVAENNEYQYCEYPYIYRKHIEVHGRPTPAVFRSEPEAGGQSSYELTWTVDSYSPIIEYRLLYRQIQPYHKV